MKLCGKSPPLLATLLAIGGCVLVGHSSAQSFKLLHPFYDYSYGAWPGNLMLAGDTLYGTTESGGTLGGGGTVFAVKTNATGFGLNGFMVLHSFPLNPTNGEGREPIAGLVLSSNTLYGTTYSGGILDHGLVFKININGADFGTLHKFTGTNTDGSGPSSALILSGNTLYGTTVYGGSSGNGTIFAINTDGAEFKTLHSFTLASGRYPLTNSDGALPVARLMLSGDTLYGTASSGGNFGQGTMFAMKTDGTGFMTLHSFTALNGN